MPGSLSEPPVVGLVCCSAGGIEQVADGLVRPLVADHGLRVAITLTPTAARWLEATGSIAELVDLTGLPVRSGARLPQEVSEHPQVSCWAVAPATANTVAKLALGIADNQALTSVSEAIGSGRVPVVIFPRINAAHSGHPMWDDHLATLRGAGVELVYGDEVWPLHQPGTSDGKKLPWSALAEKIVDSVSRSQGGLR